MVNWSVARGKSKQTQGQEHREIGREPERDEQSSETEGSHPYIQSFVAVVKTTQMQTTKLKKMQFFKNTRRMNIGLY